MAKGQRNKQLAKTKNEATKDEHQSLREPNLGSLLPAPGNLVRRFRDEVDRLFQDFGFDDLTRSLPNAESIGLGVWAPEVEIFERGGQIVVRADLPGLSKDDITIDVSERAVTIDGERKQEHHESDSGYYRSERSYGRLYRRIPLPEGVDTETAKAQFRDGVLELSFDAPVRKERKARKLEITGESAPSKSRAAGR